METTMPLDTTFSRPALFRVKEFAREHAISEAKTWEIISRGELTAVKIGSATRIRATDADAWAAKLPERKAA